MSSQSFSFRKIMRGKLVCITAASFASSLAVLMLLFPDEQLLYLSHRSALREAPATTLEPTAAAEPTAVAVPVAALQVYSLALEESTRGHYETEGADKAKKKHRNKKPALENPLGEGTPRGQGGVKHSAAAHKRRLQELVHSASKIDIKQPFHFPQPQFSQPDNYLLQSQWVFDLRKILVRTKGRQVSMVTSSIEHQDVLLNWLISAYIVASPPLDNVLVLSLDESLHNLLTTRGITSLYVSASMVINPRIEISRRFSQVHIVRLNVLRLMTNYGFDVVNYDCDAILLKNPQSIFDKHKDADIIGTLGKGPMQLFMKWGVTLNTGVLLFRSNPRVELYWEAMSELQRPTTDDQGNVNQALEYLNIRWMNLKPTDNIDTFEHEIYGVCEYRIIVMLLPFNVICRHTCSAHRRKEYYVWHALAIKENRTVENKMQQAKVGGAWFLRDDWAEKGEDLTAVEWLKEIIDWEVFISYAR